MAKNPLMRKGMAKYTKPSNGEAKQVETIDKADMMEVHTWQRI